MTSENRRENQPAGSDVVLTATPAPSHTVAVVKVKFISKALVFCMSVLTLSWFFEGWRKIHEGLGFYSVGILVAGILCTLFLLSLQSFWIYAEEKQKGTIVRKFAFFDRLLAELAAKNVTAQNLTAKNVISTAPATNKCSETCHCEGEKAKHA